MSPPPFPFIVGFGRSGTTLVRVMFDSHPEIAIGDETHFIMALHRRRRRYERANGFAVDRFVADLTRRPGFVAMGTSADDLAAALRQRPPISVADALREVFTLFAASQGKPRYGDKTPVHVRSVPALARIFPEARFVHVIRDGRDAALSYLSVPWGPASIEEAAIVWRRAVRAGRRGGATVGPERYREVRYEALVDDPETTLMDLAAFLEVEFDPAMLRYPERAEHLVQSMGFPETRSGLYLPPTPGMRDWRSQMGPADVAAFDVLAGSALAELGYERGGAPPGLPAHVAARGRLLRLECIRSARWARVRVHRARTRARILGGRRGHGTRRA